MPAKGWKKPVALTAEDYGNSAELVSSATAVLSIVAKQHPDMPMLLAAITFSTQVSQQLHALRDLSNQADQRPVSSVVPPRQDADRPGEKPAEAAL